MSVQSPALEIDSPSECRDIAGFARVACYAATELDSLRENPDIQLPNVNRLRNAISAEVLTGSGTMPDPVAITVLSWAFTDSKLFQPGPTATISDIVAEAKKVIADLAEVFAAPHNYRQAHPRRLENLRNVCLALSRQASAQDFVSGIEEPDFPERA